LLDLEDALRTHFCARLPDRDVGGLPVVGVVLGEEARIRAKFMDPNIEVIAPDGPEPGAVQGLTALVAGWRDFLTSWEDFHTTSEEYRELDDTHILVLFKRGGRGKRSGMEIRQLSGSEGADVVEVRDGKVVKIASYWERDRAFADLGLTPDTGT
jgi:ketosteroid isomerase-like protein